MSDRIAYLILCHTDPAQLDRLVTALDCQADFFIHVDAKVPATQFTDRLARKNVFFVSDRVRVYWAGFSIVQATLNLMDAACRQGDYSRLVLLNGLDYPIKPTARILEVLLGAPRREFIRFFSVSDAGSDVYRDLLVHYHFLDAPRALVNRFYDIRIPLQRLLRHVRRTPPGGYVHCFGHMQWALTKECANYILAHGQRDPRLARFYRYVFAPDERYFHTVIANSPFCAAAGGIEPYGGFGTYRMANLHHIDPSLNKVFTDTDFDELAASDKLFVKKITSKDSLGLIRRIDAELR